jgi:hypothetical protein
MKFIFFTKTNWTEPPRIRHQLANMLIKHGHEVVFFEAPTYPFKQSAIEHGGITLPDGMTFHKTKQLLHHQLRVNKVLTWLNSSFEKRQLHKTLSKVTFDLDTIVVNFNYDYIFMRELFPSNKIITVINDDFVAQAKLFEGRHTLKALAKTCSESDDVITVSYPLMEQLDPFCDPILFLPWADSAYVKPDTNVIRHSVLLWASISNVIDFDLLTEVISAKQDVQFDIIGPLHASVKAPLLKLCSQFDNVSYSEAKPLSEINTENYYASILPYKAGEKAIEAITLANKTLRLMSKGLPLITHGMPHYLAHEAIYKCSTLAEFIQAFDECQAKFHQLQDGIEQFVTNNTEEIRYQKFLEILHVEKFKGL